MVVPMEYVFYMYGSVIISLLKPPKWLEIGDVAAGSPVAHYAPIYEVDR